MDVIPSPCETRVSIASVRSCCRPRDDPRGARRASAKRKRVAASAKAEAANAQADLSSREALIAHLKLQIEKLRRELYGRARNARRGCSSRWNCSWKTWRPPQPRTNWQRRKRRPKRGRSSRSSAGDLRANHFPSTAARARGHRCAGELSLLRIGKAVEARRGRH